MQENTNEELQLRIRDLEKEVARLHAQIKNQRYGLVWLDVPEGFESETENKIPILEEVKDKAIKNDDGKPTHILIEGDNYHALTCLNYTHKGKVDVIYIDPPYNTGSDGFTYKDKRILKEFPDGTPVPKDHPMRHSYWLSFMSKRLELAKNLLSDKGVIFISIDDNEQANLKLLCDKVFDEKNCRNIINTRRLDKNLSQQFIDKGIQSLAVGCEYILMYSKTNKVNLYPIMRETSDERKEFGYWKGFWNSADRPTMRYNILGYKPETGQWKWEEKKALEAVSNYNDFIRQNELEPELTLEEYWKRTGKKLKFIRRRTQNSTGKNKGVEHWVEPSEGILRTSNWTDIITTEINNDVEINFASPKNKLLIEEIVKFGSKSKTSTILDFFAGSGTTMHAVMKLNEEDGGKRQCILVQQKENEQNICESVTYERNRRVIQGYTNSKNEKVEGLGNSLKYYKTGFVGKNNSKNATDSDKVELSLKAGYLLALAENTLEEVSRNDYYQIFEDGNGRITAVYFKGSMMRFGQFVGEIENYLSQKKTNKANVYIFCWGDVSIYENEFEDMSRISLKAIPKPILDIYKSINC